MGKKTGELICQARTKAKLSQAQLAKIVSLTTFGAFAQIIPGVDGLIHISQIARERIAKPSDVLSVGQEVDVKITELDFDRKRISLSIRALLEAGDMAEAVRCLGHPHVLTGPVVSGRHLGRTIGIPTANLALPPQLLCPRHGVYAALACFDGRRLPAVVNIGSRPTVGGTHVTVEPWILDFDGDLYGRPLRREFRFAQMW